MPDLPPLLFDPNPLLREAIAESQSYGVSTHALTPDDYAQLAALHDQVFGPGALTRTAYRVREGLPHHTPYCRLARDRAGTIIGFLRFAPISVGGRGGALMLGPLAVAQAHANQGHARRLIADGLDAAARGGIALVLLVGDLPYYGRIGFAPVPIGQILMPGPVDLARLLAVELAPDALAAYRGMIAGDKTAPRLPGRHACTTMPVRRAGLAGGNSVV